MDALIECTRPRVFIIDRANDSDRQLLGQRLPLIGENTRVAAYGPCVVTDLASATRPPSS
jgi:hypothetical protein